MVKHLIKIGSDCSGVGALIHALKRLNIDYKEEFACDFDYYARISYLANHGTEEDSILAQTKEHKFFSDNVKRISLSNTTVSDKDLKILHDANEFAKKFSFYYPFDMYNRDIPKESLDLYVSTVPCQAFSLAGKRLGKDDEKGRGILFFNSHEFIQKNKPRYFIFENVKGLLSDDSGKTFDEWIKLLGGKSVNGTSVFFPHEDSVPYHIYYSVMNSKHYGVPQNRERVFIIGIRDDEDNNFTFPAEVPLEKRLKDILEENVDEKYFLSEKMVKGLVNSKFVQEKNRIQEKEYSDSLLSRDYKSPKCVKVGYINQDTQASQVFSEEGLSPTLSAGTHGYAQGYVEVGKWNDFKDKNGNVKGFKPLQDNVAPTLLSRAREDGSGQPVIKIHSNTSKGFEEVTNEDSINFSNPHSKTRLGRVGKGVAQTLDTQCNQGVMSGYKIRRLTELEVFRLMDFPDSHVANCKKEGISNSQLYKQAGNSIVVKCLELIINNLKLV